MNAGCIPLECIPRMPEMPYETHPSYKDGETIASCVARST